MFSKGGGGQGELNGFLDAGSQLQGELRFEDTFRIDGKFAGSIVSDGDLIVGEGGMVDAEVSARRIFVSGEVRGSLSALKRVEITSEGKVRADIQTPSLTIEDGAFFEGRCSMDPPRQERKVGEKVTRMPAIKEG